MELIKHLFLLFAVVHSGYSLCNTCSAFTGVACVAIDQFSVCVGGLPTTTVTQCPNGTVCTASARICGAAATTPPSCGMCGICNGNNTFACTSYNTFALCYGTAVPDTVNYTCAGTTVCYYDDPEICVDPAIIGIGATCPLSTLVPTTTSPPTSMTTSNPLETTTSVSINSTVPTTSPKAYCANVTSPGRFEDTSDLNCKKYIFCKLLNSTWIGNLYTCPGSTFFNSTSELCDAEKPPRCV